jgi:hypothetical protein
VTGGNPQAQRQQAQWFMFHFKRMSDLSAAKRS